MENRNNRENVLVDLVKLCCAFVVVAGHCLFSDTEYLRWLPNFVDSCVQVLFIFSGYYAAKNMVLQDREKARSYIVHLMQMLLIWVIVYAVYGLYHADKTGSIWFYQYLQLEIEKIAVMDSGHLWYIEVLITVTAVLHCLKKTRFSGGESFALLIAAGVFETGLTRGLAGAALGIWLAGCPEEKQTGSSTGKRAGVLLAALAAMGLMIALHYTAAIPYWLLLIAIRLLEHLIALAICLATIGYGRENAFHEERNEKKPRKHMQNAGYYIRKLSTCVYLSHMLFIQLGIWFASRYTIWSGKKGWMLCSVFVMAVSMVFGTALIWISRRRWFGWVKTCY